MFRILVTIHFRIFCPRVSYLETYKIKHTKQHGCLLFYGCEIWSLTLQKEYRLRMFEKGELKRIFEPKREGGAEG
jgi:hypothetical protein